MKKRIFAVLLTMMMVLSMGEGAMAEEILEKYEEEAKEVTMQPAGVEIEEVSEIETEEEIEQEVFEGTEIALFSSSGGEEGVTASGTTRGINWTLYDTGILEIWGEQTPTEEGRLLVFGSWGWSEYSGNIRSVRIKSGESLALVDVEHMFGSNESGNNYDNLTSVDLSNADVTGLTAIHYIFRSSPALETADLSGWDTSSITDMSFAFDAAVALKNLSITGWDTSNVTDMNHMFAECGSLAAIDVSVLDTSNVTTMESMFHGCESLRSLDLSAFDTSSVTNMESMFYKCGSLNTIDLSDWDMSAAEDHNFMFDGAVSITSITLSDKAYCPGLTGVFLNDSGDVTNLKAAFPGAGTYTRQESELSGTSNGINWSFEPVSGTLTISGNQTGGFSMYNNVPWHPYRDGIRKIKIPAGETTRFTDTSYFFYRCPLLSDISELSRLSMSSVSSAREMFTSCSNLTGLGPVESWDMHYVSNVNRMFSGCSGLREIDLSSWNLGNASSSDGFLSGCSNLMTIKCPSRLSSSFSSSKLPQAMYNMTNGMAKTEYMVAGATLEACDRFVISEDSPKYGVKNILRLKKNHNILYFEDGMPAVISDPYTADDGVTEVTRKYYADYGDETPIEDIAVYLKTAKTGGYDKTIYCKNAGIKSKSLGLDWFYDAETKTLSLWGTQTQEPSAAADWGWQKYKNYLRNVEIKKAEDGAPLALVLINPSYMFGDGYHLEDVDLSGASTGSVTDVSHIFDGCYQLKNIDLSGWDLGSVTSADAMLSSRTNAKCGMLKCPSVLSQALLDYVMPHELLDLENDFAATTTLAAGHTLFAEIPAYSVKFYDKDGELAEEKEVSYGECLAESDFPDISRQGYLLTGWKDEDGSEVDASTVVTGDLSVYPQWKAMTKFTLTDELFGNTEVYYDGDDDGKIAAVTPAGDKTFVGWVKTNSAQDHDSPDTWDFENDVSNEDITLYAVWSGLYVTYNADGGTAADGVTLADPSDHWLYDSAAVLFGADDLVKEGYELKGWTIDEDDALMEKDETFTVMGDMVLKALWEAAEGTGVTPGGSPEDDPGTGGPGTGEPGTEDPGTEDPGTGEPGENTGEDAPGADEPAKPGDSGDYGDILPGDRPASVAEIPEGLWVTGIDPDGYTWTSAAIKPAIRVYDHKTMLTVGTDYSVSYSRNKNPYEIAQSETGFKASKAPMITIRGKGDYRDTVKQYFRINRIDLAEEGYAYDVELPAGSDVIKAGTTVTAHRNGGIAILKKGTDYTLAEDADASTDSSRIVIVTGKGKYKGRITYTASLGADIPKQKAISKAKVTGLKKSYTWTGSPIDPVSGNVTMSGSPLEMGKDYAVQFSTDDLTNTGTIKAYIIGMGAYKGTLTKTYKIVGTKMSTAKVELQSDYNYIYTGEAKTPEVKAVLKKSGTVLVEDKDYTVSFAKNVNAGKATVVLTGINGYSGTFKKTFTIKKSENWTVSEIAPAAYCKAGATPRVTVANAAGDVLVCDRDFKVTYSNSKKVAAATFVKAPTATIKGIGNYTGTQKAKFDVMDTDNTGKTDIYKAKIKVTAQDYTGGEIEADPKDVTVKIGGKTLVYGTDYVIEDYINNVKKGKAKVKITGIGGYCGEKTGTFIIKARSMGVLRLLWNKPD